MKKMLFAFLLVICLAPLSAPAVNAQTGLPPDTPGGLVQGVAKMVRANIPEQDAAAMTKRMMEGNYAEADIVRAQNLAAQTAMEGLPAKPVMSKAMEGAAKRVGAAAVFSAMEGVRSQYAYARRASAGLAADPKQREALEDVTAQCLAAGIGQKDMDRVYDRLRTRDRTKDPELAQEACSAARDMARLGASSKTTADAVCAGLEKGWSASDMGIMRQSFAQQARKKSAESLAEGYAKAAAAGVGAKGLGNAAAGTGGNGGGKGSGNASSGGSGSGSGSGSGGGSGSGSGGGRGSGGSGGGGRGGR